MLDANLIPEPGEIHLWWASLADSGAVADRAKASLAADEVARAHAFRFERDRDRFIVARATLRALLAGYLDVPVASLVFEYGAHGKPYLLRAAHLRFNVSHSQNLALYAVAREQEVGVDVEQIRPLLNRSGLIREVLSPEEARELLELPDAEQLLAFFGFWTRKEAYLKATGEGMAASLSRIDVSNLATSRPYLQTLGSRHAGKHWELRDLEAPQGYAAALAAEGSILRVVSRRWDEDAEAGR